MGRTTYRNDATTSRGIERCRLRLIQQILLATAHDLGHALHNLSLDRTRYLSGLDKQFLMYAMQKISAEASRCFAW
jgi:hypothetical protein